MLLLLRPRQPRPQALLAAELAQPLVVGQRGLQLRGRVQGADVDHVAVGQLPEPWRAFVEGVVALEPPALPVGAALPPGVDPDEERPGVVRRAFADQQPIGLHPAGVINQGRGGRPQGIVEHGGVEGRQDAVEGVLGAHGVMLLQGFAVIYPQSLRRRAYKIGGRPR